MPITCAMIHAIDKHAHATTRQPCRLSAIWHLKMDTWSSRAQAPLDCPQASPLHRSIDSFVRQILHSKTILSLCFGSLEGRIRKFCDVFIRVCCSFMTKLANIKVTGICFANNVNACLFGAKLNTFCWAAWEFFQ